MPTRQLRASTSREIQDTDNAVSSKQYDYKNQINKRSPKWYGWLPDLPDHRDLFYSAIAPKVARLPKKIDLQAKCSPAEDQGQLGSCTANSLVGATKFLEKEDGVPFVNLSRSFVYYNERVIEGTVDEDNGAFIRDGIKSLAKQGVCPEQQWPYIVNKTTFKKKPSAGCYTAAKKHRIISYHRINTVNGNALVPRGWVPIRFWLYCLRIFRIQGGREIGRAEFANAKRESRRGPRRNGCELQRQGKEVSHPQLMGIRLGQKGLLHDAFCVSCRSEPLR